MNKKLLVVPMVLAVSIMLQACGNKKEVKTTNATTTETAQKQDEQKATTEKKISFNTYKEMTEFGKEKTSKFADLSKKNNIESVVTLDNMYAVNKQQKIKKYNNEYNFYADYTVNPNFETGHGAGVVTLYYEKHIDDHFSKDDNKIKFMNDIINQLTPMKNLTIDDFVKKLNDADNNAKSDGNKKCVISLDENKSVSLTVNHNIQDSKNLTQLMIKYADPFDNYIIKPKQKNYETVAAFMDNNKQQKQVEEFFSKSGYKSHNDGKHSDFLIFSNGQSKETIEVSYRHDDINEKGFLDGYNLAANSIKYDVENPPKNNSSLNMVYNFIKTFTLNDTLNEEEFEKYINSYVLYEKYHLQIEPINEGESKYKTYYLPFVNVKTNSSINASMFTIEYNNGIDFLNKTECPKEIRLSIDFEVPVIAEGKTRK